jgi:hypothetical protein
MTAKVTSLCDYRRSKDAERKLRRGRELGLPDFEMEEEESTLKDIKFYPEFELDPDDY